MDLSERPMRSFEVTIASALGETYLIKARQAFRVNPVGIDIWNALEGEMTLGEVVDLVAAKYDAPKETIAYDVQRFCGDLLRRGMID